MSIDTDKLLNDPGFKSQVSEQRYAEYLSDVNALFEDMNSGVENILVLWWDANSPGNNGHNCICKWKGFYFFSASHYEPEGPFETFNEVYEMEYFHTDTPNPKLYSRQISLETLLEYAIPLVCLNKDSIIINDKLYAWEGDNLGQDLI